jgi:hypothetical protein
MQTHEIEFTLPLGLSDEEGNLFRKGKMRLATAYDEILIQDHEKNAFNIRYRDLLVLSQVITELGDYSKITPELLQNLYEVDFIYLQLIYKELNSSQSRKAEARCPACGHNEQIEMANLFRDMHYYYQQQSTGNSAKTS